MVKRIPSLNWLRVFEASARMGSFARAAERLGMSPPAVSQQIRALEAHLGRPLFDRAPAGVTLTEAGRNLMAGVGDALVQMETAAEAVSAPSGPPLVIGVSMMLSVSWLAPRLSGFVSRNRDITLELHSMLGRPETPPRDAVLWIAFGPPAPGTEATLLFGERLVPVACADVAARIGTRRDLLDHMLIEVADQRKNWGQVFGAEMLPAGARVLYVDTTLAALTLAASGAGIALARPPASDEVMARYGLVPCLPGFELPGIESYFLLHKTDIKLSRKAQAFHTWICAETEETRRTQAI